MRCLFLCGPFLASFSKNFPNDGRTKIDTVDLDLPCRMYSCSEVSGPSEVP